MAKFIVTRLTLFILFGLFKTSAIFGQTLTVQIGIVDSIQSDILKETRKFIVYHPQDYDTSQKKYPVLYLLDGSVERLQFFASMMNFYFKDNSIIVAIQNTNRDSCLCVGTRQALLQGWLLCVGFVCLANVPDLVCWLKMQMCYPKRCR